MPKKFGQIREDLLNTPHDNRSAAGPDIIKRDTKALPRNHISVLSKNAQRPDKKWKAQALAGKLYEPNRTKTRHPYVPPQRATGPNEVPGITSGIREEVNNERDDFDPKKENEKFAEDLKRMAYEQATKKTFKDIREGRESEYSANRQLSATSSSKRKSGHYLMRHGVALHNEPHATSQQALSAYHNLSDKSNVKIQHIKEENTPGYSRGDVVHWHEHPSTGHSGIMSGYVVGTIANTGYRVKRHDNNKVVPVGHGQIIHHHREQYAVGQKVRVDADQHGRHGMIGHVEHVGNFGDHHVRFGDGHREPFQEGELQKIASRNSAVGSITNSNEAYEPTKRGQSWMASGYPSTRPIYSPEGACPDCKKTYAYEKKGGLSHKEAIEIARQSHEHGHPELRNEEAVAMSAGAVGDPGHVQNATDNYASQLDQLGKKKLKSMLRRKPPVTMGVK